MVEENFKHHIETDPDGMFVKAWSTGHLPFTLTTEAHHCFHDKLGKAITTLKKSRVLHATYGFRKLKRGLDVDNVLFYNVNTARFKNISMDVLRFERRHDWIPKPPVCLAFEPLHYVQYQIEKSKTQFSYTEGHAVARCRPVVCQKIKTANLWRSFKSEMVSDADATLPYGSQFSVQLTIREFHCHNLANIVKPMLDGFISALHYNHVLQDEVVERVAKQLGASRTDMRKLLIDSRNALLGPRPVPHLRPPNGLQWSPADDQLFAGEIIREATSAGEKTEISGCLFTAAGTSAEDVKRGFE